MYSLYYIYPLLFEDIPPNWNLIDHWVQQNVSRYIILLKKYCASKSIPLTSERFYCELYFTGNNNEGENYKCGAIP